MDQSIVYPQCCIKQRPRLSLLPIHSAFSEGTLGPVPRREGGNLRHCPGPSRPDTPEETQGASTEYHLLNNTATHRYKFLLFLQSPPPPH